MLSGIRPTFGKLAAIYRLHRRHHGLMQSAVLIYWRHHGLMQSAVLIYCRYHGLMQPVVLISCACGTNILDICDNHTRAHQLDLRESPTPSSMGSSQVRPVCRRSTTWRVARDRTGRDSYDALTDAGSPRMRRRSRSAAIHRRFASATHRSTYASCRSKVRRKIMPQFQAGSTPSRADSSGRACNTSGAMHHTMRELIKGPQLEPKRSMVVYRGFVMGGS